MCSSLIPFSQNKQTEIIFKDFDEIDSITVPTGDFHVITYFDGI